MLSSSSVLRDKIPGTFWSLGTRTCHVQLSRQVKDCTWLCSSKCQWFLPRCLPVHSCMTFLLNAEVNECLPKYSYQIYNWYQAWKSRSVETCAYLVPVSAANRPLAAIKKFGGRNRQEGTWGKGHRARRRNGLEQGTSNLSVGGPPCIFYKYSKAEKSSFINQHIKVNEEVLFIFYNCHDMTL